jgi:hypothetical protein
MVANNLAFDLLRHAVKKNEVAVKSVSGSLEERSVIFNL